MFVALYEIATAWAESLANPPPEACEPFMQSATEQKLGFLRSVVALAFYGHRCSFAELSALSVPDCRKHSDRSGRWRCIFSAGATSALTVGRIHLMGWLHHLFLHLPLALAPVATLYMLWGVTRREHAERAAAAGRWTTYLGALSGALSATTGLAAAPHVLEAGIHRGALELHRNLSLGAAFILFCAAFYSFRCARRHLAVRLPELFGSCLASAAIGLAGHFGGELLHPNMAPWSAAPHVHGADQQLRQRDHFPE